MPTSFCSRFLALTTFSGFPVIENVVTPDTLMRVTVILSTPVNLATLSQTAVKFPFGEANWLLLNLTFSVTSGEARFFEPGMRGAGAGVDARDELAERPLVPLVAGTGDRLMPHEDTGLAAVDLPRDGKSPSERRLGGVLGLRECRGAATSGCESASN